MRRYLLVNQFYIYITENKHFQNQALISRYGHYKKPLGILGYMRTRDTCNDADSTKMPPSPRACRQIRPPASQPWRQHIPVAVQRSRCTN